MPIEINAFNTLFAKGRGGRKFEIRFCPTDKHTPWSVQTHGQGKYFESLREALAFCAGRGWIETHEITAYQNEIMQTLDRKWDEPGA